MDDKRYLHRQREDFDRYEGMCKRCGECCGAGNDPCVNLVKDAAYSYICRIYDARLGPQKTLSGKDFNCVLIRDNAKFGPSHRGCAYASGGLK